MNPKNSRFRHGLARQAALLALLLPGLAAAALPPAESDRNPGAATMPVVDIRAAAADPAPIRLAWDRVGIQMT